MKTSHETPIQFYTNDGIGLRLANATARKRLHHTTRDLRLITSPPLSGNVLEDTIALGAEALLQHVRQLIHDQPLQSLIETQSRSRIRVCGAVDYVIDRAKQRVWSEPAPLTTRESLTKQHPPWHHPFSGPLDIVDILHPLSRPAWLVHVAARPGWFGYAFARHADNQQQLFVQQDEMTQALSRITNIVWRHMWRDRALVALRHNLSSCLTLQIGPGLINLAMRARLQTRNVSLNARHLNLVWQHRPAFETMERENPRLLVALTAWLLHDKANDHAKLPDALPQMRHDLMNSGLPPKAWRYLAQFGINRLLPTQLTQSSWTALINSLRALSASRWPAPPPRGFLRLLHDAAGMPDNYDTATHGVPGWFWQLTCNEACACKGDAGAYLALFDCVPEWAWLVRKFEIAPDKNQRRKRITWLSEVAQAHHQLALQDDTPAWALWLQSAQWDEVPGLEVVPLLSPVALLQEAIAMHNCVDSYTQRCQEETHVLLSLRKRRTGKRVALASVVRSGSSWRLGQLTGPCNRPVTAWLRKVTNQAVEVVRYHHAQHLHTQEEPHSALNPNL